MQTTKTEHTLYKERYKTHLTQPELLPMFTSSADVAPCVVQQLPVKLFGSHSTAVGATSLHTYQSRTDGAVSSQCENCIE